MSSIFIKSQLILFLVLLSIVKVDAQNKEGTITVVVDSYCEIIVDHPNRPIHFSCNNNWQHHTKHVKVISNCKWSLRVRPQDRYLYCHQYKIDVNLISYHVGNTHGSGSIQCPEPSYLLYQEPYYPPFGIGSIEFDVIFSLDTSLLRRFKWGNYNTKVQITCTPETN